MAGYTAISISVDVAGVLTALGSLGVALLAHRRISRLSESWRRQSVPNATKGPAQGSDPSASTDR